MLKKLFVIGLILCGLAVLFVVLVNIHIVNYTKKYIYEYSEEINEFMDNKADAAIVFGAHVYSSGRPCPVLVDRLNTGIDAIQKNYTSRIILSGDHGTKGYDEVNAMKEFVFAKGIAKKDVFLDHAGFSTYDTVYRARDIFCTERVILSTQRYHLYRAVYIARKLGLDAYGIASDLRMYPKREMQMYTIREWLARTKDFIYVNILKPKPEILGEKIPYWESSRDTYDID